MLQQPQTGGVVVEPNVGEKRDPLSAAVAVVTVQLVLRVRADWDKAVRRSVEERAVETHVLACVCVCVCVCVRPSMHKF